MRAPDHSAGMVYVWGMYLPVPQGNAMPSSSTSRCLCALSGARMGP